MTSLFRRSHSRRPSKSFHSARPGPDQTQVLAFVGILVGLLIATALGFVGGYAIGNGGRQAPAQSNQQPGTIDPSTLGRMDEVMQTLRSGDTGLTLGLLDLLRASNPDFPSLHYVYALTWLAAGQPHRADEFAKSSVMQGERVSDSLALQAAILKASSSPGDHHLAPPDTMQRDLLLRAVATDPLNPAPRIELAHLLRSTGDREGARAQFRAARALLHPVDSAIVIETTLAIMDAEDGIDPLPPAEPSAHSTIALHFARAATALKAGDQAASRSALETANPLCNPDTFAYLAADPALRSPR